MLSFSVYHKYYLSVTDVNYSEKNQAIQMISRYFIDDMEKLFTERYSIVPKLGSAKEMEDVDRYIQRYLRDKFIIFINGKKVDWSFVGKQYDVDVMKVYLEIPNIPKNELQNIGVKSTVLYGIYPDQKNVVHIKVADRKISYVLFKGNDNALLKL